jgi:hypothetical protein
MERIALTMNEVDAVPDVARPKGLVERLGSAGAA